MLPERTSVLVVGAGPVGLSAAAFLGWHGIDSVVVDRHPGLSGHPRARGITPRTMELLRVIGLEERVRGTASARELAANDGIHLAESLAGRPLGQMRQPYFQFGSPNFEELSPTSWCMCHQDELEPILRDRAVELGADVHFGVECTAVEPDGDGVWARLRPADGGTERRLRADYVIAADGANGRIRQWLGIGTSGPGRLGHFLNISFEADLSAQLGERRFIMCYITKAGVRCALLPVDNARRWMLHVMCEPEEVPGITEERCVELVRAAAGVPDLEVRIAGALPWESAGRVADRMRAGRVFLAGDAAHVMPPTGAFGSNTGIQDAHNLAWKLAAVLRGRAGDALLDTYEAERLPVARETMLQAVLRSKDRPGAGRDAAAPVDPRIVADPVVVLGYRYRSSAVVPEDGAASGEETVWAPQAAGEPGTRAPHVALAAGSTIDLVRRRFVVFAGPAEGAAWREACAEVERDLGVPFDVYTITDGAGEDTGHLHDLEGRWAAGYGVDPGGAVLVRPDGFVAWRSRSLPEDPGGELRRAMTRVLAVAAPAATGV
ncbi:FAD-dependent monooxygenase [Thermomonospora cellulosilytica]|uniref:Putative polyketide hydroxylase n=1 Tax=Thermomonospora cellulosilytica TaxID=1411118 RepID=A0A7W3N111_9ACTN|nr:FAD-dependent monooxygenase [Thermomonospora cellulosilytica]MBA9005538.1 putative polyketide hydroxylase [Thermomonospora cellulosilytica]